MNVMKLFHMEWTEKLCPKAGDSELSGFKGLHDLKVYQSSDFPLHLEKLELGSMLLPLYQREDIEVTSKH